MPRKPRAGPQLQSGEAGSRGAGQGCRSRPGCRVLNSAGGRADSEHLAECLDLLASLLLLWFHDFPETGKFPVSEGSSPPSDTQTREISRKTDTA